MATFSPFHCFTEDVAKKQHDLHSDTIKLALSNTEPDAANDTVFSDITEISAGNGYSTGGVDVTNSVSRSLTTTTTAAVDVTITASGGNIGPFQYAILYNSTNNKLIGYWSLGGSFTILEDDAISGNFADDKILTISIT